MDLLSTTGASLAWSAQARQRGDRVALVPTMGALHEGHLALVDQAKGEADLVACSIFVNPLQFNDPADLERYPRRVEADLELLRSAGCNAVFLPAKEDLFHDFVPATYDLAGMDAYWEGPSRPGHFQGVVNVVERLFFHIRPDVALFGEKDRQQLTIIRSIGDRYHWPERIVASPTLRATDGLALSSRNQLLTAFERAQAPLLFKALSIMRETASTSSVDEVVAAGRTVLDHEPALTVDYLGLAHPRTLEPKSEWGGETELIALVAVQLGRVRLIDNMLLRRDGAHL